MCLALQVQIGTAGADPLIDPTGISNAKVIVGATSVGSLSSLPQQPAVHAQHLPTGDRV